MQLWPEDLCLFLLRFSRAFRLDPDLGILFLLKVSSSDPVSPPAQELYENLSAAGNDPIETAPDHQNPWALGTGRVVASQINTSPKLFSDQGVAQRFCEHENDSN